MINCVNKNNMLYKTTIIIFLQTLELTRKFILPSHTYINNDYVSKINLQHFHNSRASVDFATTCRRQRLRGLKREIVNVDRERSVLFFLLPRACHEHLMTEVLHIDRLWNEDGRVRRGRGFGRSPSLVLVRVTRMYLANVRAIRGSLCIHTSLKKKSSSAIIARSSWYTRTHTCMYIDIRGDPHVGRKNRSTG